MNKIQEHCFNKTTIEQDLEVYSHFLNSNDYEYYMQFIDPSPIDKETWEIQKEIAQQDLVRALWIRNRFTKYTSKENIFYGTLTNLEYYKLKLLQA